MNKEKKSEGFTNLLDQYSKVDNFFKFCGKSDDYKHRIGLNTILNTMLYPHLYKIGSVEKKNIGVQCDSKPTTRSIGVQCNIMCVEDVNTVKNEDPSTVSEVDWVVVREKNIQSTLDTVDIPVLKRLC